MDRSSIYVIFSSLLLLIRLITANIILSPKHSGLLTVIAGAGVHLAHLGISERFFFSYETRIITGIVLYLFFIQLFYTEGWAEKAFYSLMICLPAVFYGYVYDAFGVPSGDPELLLFFLLCLLLLVPMIFLLRKFREKNDSAIADHEFFPLCVFPLSQLLILMLFRPSPAKPFLTFAVPLACILSDLVMIRQIDLTASYRKLRLRNEILEEHMSMIERSAPGDPSFRDLAKIRHDIGNHLLAMKALLGGGKQEEAEKYLNAIETSYQEVTHFPACLNSTIALFLEKKYEEIRQAGITLQSDIQLPGRLGVSDPDLVCIYGNLLDNAIEACRMVPDAEIVLNTLYQSPYLTVSCRNPVPASIQKEQRIPGMQRGTGFAILSDIADRYDGQFHTENNNSMFFAEIILKIRPEVQNDQNSHM